MAYIAANKQHYPDTSTTPSFPPSGNPPIATLSAIPAQAGIQPITMRQACVYMLASRRNGTLYIGVTSNLLKRVFEHRTESVDSFSRKYHVHRLVYYEVCPDITSAILREKQLKKWNRSWKPRLIEKSNPEWEDLYPTLL